MATDPGLRRLVLGTLLAAFQGHSAPGWATDLLADGLAGHVLFYFNIDTPAQVAALVDQLRTAAPAAVVGIDEEGGDVTRLGHATGSPYPGNAALGVVDDTALTEAVYRSVGAELAAVGVNLDIAPTVDVNSVAENPIIGTRSFSADPKVVAEHAGAAVTGLQAAGVAACAKHFPGHGATVADSHHDLPVIDAPLDVVRVRDLPPFAAAIAAGAKSIMTAHIRFPALSRAPATFSRRILVDLLRGELGFTGAIITDALEMKGAADTAGSIEAAAVLALSGGADLLCLGADIDAGIVESVAAEVAAAVADGRLGLGRLEEAAGRVAELAAWAAPGQRSAEVDPGIGYDAARRAVRVEGAVGTTGTPLIVELAAGHTVAEGRVPWGLGPHLNGDATLLRVVAADTSATELAASAGGRPIVLVYRNAARNPDARALADDLAGRYPVVAVDMGWPSEWRPTGARGLLRTYGASHANARAAAEALGLLEPVHGG